MRLLVVVSVLVLTLCGCSGGGGGDTPTPTPSPTPAPTPCDGCPAVFEDGVLIVNGDASDNTFTVSVGTASNLVVNAGAIQIFGDIPTLTNTTRIRIFG